MEVVIEGDTGGRVSAVVTCEGDAEPRDVAEELLAVDTAEVELGGFDASSAGVVDVVVVHVAEWAADDLLDTLRAVFATHVVLKIVDRRKQRREGLSQHTTDGDPAE